MRRFLRLFDWRLALSMALLAAVAWLVFVGIQTQRDNAVKQERINDLISFIQHQNAEFDTDRKTLLADEGKLLADQGLLLQYTKQLAEREQALLEYLRAHGIRLPTRLVTQISPPRLIPVPVAQPPVAPPTKPAPPANGKGKGGPKK